MTPLQRAIEAVHNTPRRKGDALDVSDEGAEDIVRAVLMAIREPGSAITNAVVEGWFSVRVQNGPTAWIAGIDAILETGK